MNQPTCIQPGSLADHGENLKKIHTHPFIAKIIDVAIANYEASSADDNEVVLCDTSKFTDFLTIAAVILDGALKSKDRLRICLAVKKVVQTYNEIVPNRHL